MCEVFKEVTLEIGKISSNINTLESNIKNKLEVKLRPRHKNYNINHYIQDEDNDIPKQIKRAGKNDREPKIWDQWGNWSTCSVTCGIGKIMRWRHCISGSCSLGEKKAQLKTCTSAAC
ncbi:thrombospondin-2-like isoform X2 [Camponotus floridanus]|uniref:thrombospondin-2-like isoform X2 n=1 Tax=Camponotus floridanus TaxID=104421 RepID=UPI00059B6369|nr:thrombospondin-2-like isoform X2 [Camponotus floridanus]